MRRYLRIQIPLNQEWARRISHFQHVNITWNTTQETRGFHIKKKVTLTASKMQSKCQQNKNPSTLTKSRKNNKTIIILKNNPFSFSTALQSLSFEHCERTYDARPPGCTVLESLNRRRGGGAPAAEPEPWRTSELIAPWN